MLLPYQIPHVEHLKESFKNSHCSLDASDTGTGKTYCTIELCKQMNLKPFIICPKSVINTWYDVAKLSGVEILGISNYEKLKGCRYYTPEFEVTTCPYIDKTVTTKNKEEFMFQLPQDTLVVIDEAHKCKNSKTVNSKMLLALRESGRKILLLSATITDKIECFKPFGVVFRFYNDVKKYKQWLRDHIKKHNASVALKQKYDPNFQADTVNTSDEEFVLKLIHKSIFPSMGSRMKIKELGDLFPQNQVVAKCYYSDDHGKVTELYNMINKALEDLKDKEKKSSALGQIVRCRMRIEMYKLPIIMDLTDDALENGNSVAIFVNFKDSMNYLCHHFKEDCSLIHGEQTLEDRTFNIENFQTNKTKIIICIIQAGGVGISLHDLNGRPRMSIISPSWSGTDVVQALGRIHRAGSKSPAIQRIVYIAKSYEEEICKTLEQKLSVLSGINDGDLAGPNIPKENLKELGELMEDNNNVVLDDDLNNDMNNDSNNNIDGNENQKPNAKPVKKIKKKKFVPATEEDINSKENTGEKKVFDIEKMDKPPFGGMDPKYVAK